MVEETDRKTVLKIEILSRNLERRGDETREFIKRNSILSLTLKMDARSNMILLLKQQLELRVSQ